MAPGLHDPRASRAVLIGTHTYDHLTDLPAVADNLRALRTALTDPLIWGLPDEHCVVVEQPGSADDALEAVAEAAAAATDLLLVYFAGHGLLSPTDDSLDLALRGSRRDQRFRRLNYEAVRGVLRDARHIRAKAVVLDCCFAGRAIVGAMGPPVELADISHVEGTYLLAAASATEAAVAPPGEKHTAFTGELLDILANGISGADPYLDFGRIHDHLCARLAAKDRPRPRQRNDGHGSRIVLARNRSAAPAAEEDGVRGPLRDLLGAQQRAASKFPYRLYGAPANALATVYVRQQTRAYASERDRRSVESASDRRRWNPRREDARRDEAQRADQLTSSVASVQPLPPLPQQASARSGSVAPLRPVDEALALHRHLLVLGGPGQGKSTLTLQLAASLAAEFRSDDPDSVVPLRVTAAKLADMDGPWNTRVERAVTEELGPFLDGALPPDILSRLPEDHARLLIVDGLDEITNPDQRRTFIAMLGSRLQDKGVPYRLMITSRPLPQDELEFINQLALGTYTLEPFSREQLKEFAGRWFGDTESGRLHAQSFLHQIGRTGVRELSRVPLLATIAAIVFREGAAGPLPTSRFRLYERYFAYLDRDQTAAQHRQKEQILEDLKYAHEVHVQSVSYLFSHRRELVEHLADSVVSVRDADAEPRDLLRTALAWLDRNGCRPTRLQLPQWPTLVATFLGASGLFVLQGDRLRFVHYTFAEHIAADVRARSLPPDFDPDDVEWRTLLDEALDANMQAWAVIVHHSNLGDSGDAVLTWLNSGGTRHQALAGTLLSNGVEADEGHTSLFVDHVVHRLRNELTESERRQIIRDVAGLMQHPEMRTAIDRYLRHGYRTYEMQVEVARAIGPEVPEIAGAALRASMRDQGSGGSHRAQAAGALVELMPRHLDEAVDILRDIITSERSTHRERVSAARVLGAADAGLVDEAARTLRAVVEDDEAPPAAIGEAAVGLVSFGAAFTDEAATVLRRLAADSAGQAGWIGQVAVWLAELGPEHAADAAAIMCAEAARRTQDDRLVLARAMAQCGPAHVGEATRMARDIIAHADATPIQCQGAAGLLGTLGFPAEAAATLMRLARDVCAPVGVRTPSALSAARLDTSLDDEAGAVLHALARDPDSTPYARADAAGSLARLGGSHHQQAVALLRAEMRSDTCSIGHRIAFAAALGTLDPAYTAEATTVITNLKEIIEAPHRLLSELASTLAGFGAQHTDEAAAILRTVLAHPDADPSVRVGAAQQLARLSPAFVAEAASALRGVLASQDAAGYDRRSAAETLFGLAPRYEHEAAAALLAIAVGVDNEEWIRLEAAQQLARTESVLAREGIAYLLELADEPRVQSARLVGIARTIADVAPEHAPHVLGRIREYIGSPDTRLSSVAILIRGLASVDPGSVAETADILRRRVLTGEGTALERRWAAFCLGDLGPQFHDESARLCVEVMSADDVDPATSWTLVSDLDDLGPRFRDEAAECLRAALSDRLLGRSVKAELTRLIRRLSDARSAAEVDAVLLELFTADDTPRSVRREAARDLLTYSPRHQHDVAAALLGDALNEGLPLLERLRAVEALLAADYPVDRQAAAMLPGLLEYAADPGLRLTAASILADAGKPFRDQAAEVAREILADPSAASDLHLRAATELRRAGAQYRDEAMRVFRAIAESGGNAMPSRVRAAYSIATSGQQFEAEGAAMLRGLLDHEASASTVAAVGDYLSYLSRTAYEGEATALLRQVARDGAAPAGPRRMAAERLAELGPRLRPEALDVLREIVADPAVPARTRRLAAEQLGMFGSACAAEAAEVLFGMAEASGPRTYARRAALRSASRLGLGYARKAMAKLDALEA